MSRVEPDSDGFYGEYGGAFIPEMLWANVDELKRCYRGIIASDAFAAELDELLRDYAGRPTPLFLSRNLSKQYGAQIYLKREDLLHTGAHKINNTLGQVLLARHMGKRRIIAETGAGQHGVATATVCALLGMECRVFMGEVDMERQKPNVERMRMIGAEVVPAVSGSRTLKDATNEAIREWIANPEDTHYVIGSVVGPHPYPDMVARFQSVIGSEIAAQVRERLGREAPDYVVACVGGGSNAVGAFYPFVGNGVTKLIAVEAAGEGVESGRTAATMALGRQGIIHGSMTYLMQDGDGQITEPHSVSAGLDYPGVGPVHAWLHDSQLAEVVSATDREALDAAFSLTRSDGIIPALESAHALAHLEKMELASDDIVVVVLSGRGDKDMMTYQKVMSDERKD